MSDHQTYIIAEMACSHEGDINYAKKIIQGAVDAKANAVQLQIWQAEKIISPTHKDFALLKRIELSRDDFNFLL